MIVRLGLAQINTTVGDLKGNVTKINEYIDLAEKKGVSILVFPELAITGYPPEDLVLRTGFIKDNLSALEKVREYTIDKELLVILGFVDFDFEIYNAAAVLHNGEKVAVYRKMHLPNYSVFDEKRYFSAGKKALILRNKNLRIGVNICEDLWVPSGPINEQTIFGANLIINLSASPFTAGKSRKRLELLSTRASEYSCAIAYCNLVGGQDELVFDGLSAVVLPDGRSFIARGFEEELFITDLDLDIATRYNLYEGKRKSFKANAELEEKEISFTLRDNIEFLTSHRIAEGIEEIFNALVLGLRDYVKKNGFSTVTLGLSGGMDSSLAACIAVEALGRENVVGVLMPSEYTSNTSIEDAKMLAKNLGIKTLTVPITAIYHSYLGTLSDAFKGREQDVTEENIQARIRGNILMALSNKFGWLVLATGNKSELATGYATLYGDMAGGFAVLKDVYKTDVYRLADYFNRTKKTEIIPRRVFEKPPSAELRPNQTDQDTLPPYETLDKILKLFIEEGLSANEILEHGFDNNTVNFTLKLLKKNEYKRRQGAPGIKISRRAFGKDWRMPITNDYNTTFMDGENGD
ncbi:NAD+ synthase [Kosmotoga olearia]|uniref:Glutamine-dependent NAD(+) synthetase n=1 Tax=Kosmotoga olearia (strain ATCC BAA-1733 / DSM 21960 / TBF 19.5.1) TaxID=521045 RepID=C5CF39_KOSOT|nr:NAD+ synthase [Kosmotoga olearia]ACR80304.1 NAD+ synthetase [Kosmotoga olearia TBF 19.5.1]